MTDRTEEIRSLLRRREAGRIEHPGGTLFAHLERVSERLGRLGAGPDLQVAALGHALYGTDGFDLQLVALAHRQAIQDMIGPAAELIIYRYAACDRKRTWPGLAATGQVWDRFDSSAELLDPAALRDFADLCIVNELDVLEQSPPAAERYRDYFARLFGSWRPIASAPVHDDARAVLAGLGSAPPGR